MLEYIINKIYIYKKTIKIIIYVLITFSVLSLIYLFKETAFMWIIGLSLFYAIYIFFPTSLDAEADRIISIANRGKYEKALIKADKLLKSRKRRLKRKKYEYVYFKYISVKAHCLTNIGLKKHSLFMFEESIKYSSMFKEYYKKILNKPHDTKLDQIYYTNINCMIITYVSIAELKDRNKFATLAIKEFEELNKSFLSESNLKLYLTIILNYARALILLYTDDKDVNNLKNALGYYEEAGKIASNVSSKSNIYYIKIMLAKTLKFIYQDLGYEDYKLRSIKYFMESIVYFDQLSPQIPIRHIPLDYGWCNYRLAQCYTELSELENREDALELAQNFFKEAINGFSAAKDEFMASKSSNYDKYYLG